MNSAPCAVCGINDTLVFSTRSTGTDALRRSRIVHFLKLGLVRYAAHSPAAEKLSVSSEQPGDSGESEQERTDWWDYWVFSIDLHSFLNGEEARIYQSHNATISANRVTRDFKLNLSLYNRFSQTDYSYEDYSYVDVSRSRNASAFGVESLNDHW